MSWQDRRRWLDELATTRGAYERLISDEGSIALAAHRLATAKAACYPVPSCVPTAREVVAAAREIASRIPGFDVIPTARVLVDDCARAGKRIAGR